MSRKIIEIRKFCYHGNLTSQVSSLSNNANKALYREIHSFGKKQDYGTRPRYKKHVFHIPGASVQKGRNSVSTVLFIVTQNSSKMQ